MKLKSIFEKPVDFFKNNKKICIIVGSVIAAVLVVLIVLISLAGIKKNKEQPYYRVSQANIIVRSDMVSIVTKGGFTKNAPLNTMQALRDAQEAEYYEVEVDAQRTKDGIWVAFQDETLNKTTDLRGKISDYTYNELCKANIDYDYKNDYEARYKIPTIEQVLDFCSMGNMKPYIRIISDGNRKIGKLVKSIEKYGLGTNASIISADPKQLIEAQKYSDNVECWYLMKKITDENIGVIKANPEVGAMFDADDNGKLMIERLCKTGAKVGCYVVNDIKEFEKIYKYGVSCFITEKILWN